MGSPIGSRSAARATRARWARQPPATGSVVDGGGATVGVRRPRPERCACSMQRVCVLEEGELRVGEGVAGPATRRPGRAGRRWRASTAFWLFSGSYDLYLVQSRKSWFNFERTTRSVRDGRSTDGSGDAQSGLIEDCCCRSPSSGRRGGPDSDAQGGSVRPLRGAEGRHAVGHLGPLPDRAVAVAGGSMEANPQIKDPHLIYPGDILRLVWIDGQPRIVMDRGDERLGPQIRVESLETRDPDDSGRRHRRLSVRPTVVSEAELDDMPYVLDIGGEPSGCRRGLHDLRPRHRRRVERPLQPVPSGADDYRDPDDQRKARSEAVHVGDRHLDVGRRPGDAAADRNRPRSAARRSRWSNSRIRRPTSSRPRPTAASCSRRRRRRRHLPDRRTPARRRGRLDLGQVLSIWQSGREAIDRWGKKSFSTSFNQRVERPHRRRSRAPRARSGTRR